MKIYNKVVIDMKTLTVLEEDSYEYDGPLALCGGGSTTVEAAQPSAAEIEYYNLMNSNIKSSMALQEALSPYILSSLGLKTVTPTWSEEDTARINQLNQEIAAYDSAPNAYRNNPENQAAQRARLAEQSELKSKYATTYAEMTDDEYYNSLSATEKQTYDLQKAQSERLLKAYAGELEIPATIQENLDREKAILDETIARQGSNSTAAIQKQKAFDEKVALIKDAVQHGEMDSGTVAYLNTLGFLNADTSGDATTYSNYTTTPLATMGAISTALQPYQYYSGLTQQANLTNASNANARTVGLMQGLGALAGTGTGIGLSKYL